MGLLLPLLVLFIYSFLYHLPVPSHSLSMSFGNMKSPCQGACFCIPCLLCTPNSPSPASLLVCVCVGHKPMLLFSGASQFYFVRQGISLTQESTFGIHWLSREPLRSTYVWCPVLWLPVYVTRPSFFMSFGAQNSCAHSYTERVSPT